MYATAEDAARPGTEKAPAAASDQAAASAPGASSKAASPPVKAGPPDGSPQAAGTASKEAAAATAQVEAASGSQDVEKHEGLEAVRLSSLDKAYFCHWEQSKNRLTNLKRDLTELTTKLGSCKQSCPSFRKSWWRPRRRPRS